MSGRIPSRELIRFLLNHFAMSDKTLQDVEVAIKNFPDESWATYDREDIVKDLAATMQNNKGTNARVRDLAKPVVLCLFDDGGQGKSTFANLLVHQGIPKFSTDHFVTELRDGWHGDQRLQELATRLAPLKIDQFIEQAESDSLLGNAFVSLFFNDMRGFSSKMPVTLIEGFLHHPRCTSPAIRLDKAIAHELRQRGYRVWIANRVRETSLHS